MAGETRKGSLLPDVTSPEASDLVFLLRPGEAQPIARNKKITFANLLRTAITSVIKFTQSGTGAVERTVDSKLKDVVSVKDFGATTTTSVVNQAAATAAAAGRVLRFPAVETYNFTYTQPPYGSAWDFEGLDINARLFGIPTDELKVGRASLTVYGGSQPFSRSAFYNRTVAQGSGVNGPQRGNFGHTIDVLKDKFGTGTANCGEIDGLYIVTRNDRNISDSSSYSDSAGILIDTDQMEGTGFACLMEGSTKNISRSTFAVTKKVNVQLAPLNEVPGAIYSYGIVLTSTDGQNTAGVLVQSPDAAAAFQDLFIGRVGNKSMSWRLESDGTLRLLQGGLPDSLRFRPNGKVAIGGSGTDAHNFYNHLQLGGGAGPTAFLAAGAVSPSATSEATYFLSQANANAGASISNVTHFRATWGTVSSTATVGSYYGFAVNNTTLSDVYSFRSSVASGSNRWNLFMEGTAPNYLRGNLAIGNYTAFHSSGDSVLGIANGVEPTAAAPDAVQLYSYGESAGNTLLGLRTQGNAVTTESLAADRSLRVRINGTTYKLLLKSI
jgi:hypothetical protein